MSLNIISRERTVHRHGTDVLFSRSLAVLLSPEVLFCCAGRVRVVVDVFSESGLEVGVVKLNNNILNTFCVLFNTRPVV